MAYELQIINANYWARGKINNNKEENTSEEAHRQSACVCRSL